MQARTEWQWREPPLGGALPALLLITVAAIAVRLGLIARAGVIDPDGAFYARLAQDLLRGVGTRGFHPAWPPGYPHLIAAMSQALAWLGLAPAAELDTPWRVEHAARVVSAVAGGLLTLPVFALARRCGAPRLGLLAALLVAGHPALLEVSTQVMTESTFALLFLTCVALLFRPAQRAPDALSAAGAGVAAGLAQLTRPEAVLLVVVGGLYLLLQARPAAAPGAAAHRNQWGPALRTTLIFVLPALLVALPHAVRVSRAVGHASFGAKSDYNLGLAYAGLPGVADITRSRSTYNNLTGQAPDDGFPEPIPAFHWVSLMRNRPLAVLGHVLRQLPLSASALPSLATWPVLLLALVFLERWRPWNRGWRPGLLTGLWVGYVLLYALVFVYRRFFVAFLPLPLLGAAGALRARLHPGGAADPARATPGPLAFPAQCGVALLLAGFGVAVAGQRLATAPEALEQRALGEWLRAAPGESRGGVMARRPTVAWYADRPILSIPEGGAREIREGALERGAGWVVVDERDLVRERPGLAGLLMGAPDSSGGPGAAAGLAAWPRRREAGLAPARAVLLAVPGE